MDSRKICKVIRLCQYRDCMERCALDMESALGVLERSGDKCFFLETDIKSLQGICLDTDEVKSLVKARLGRYRKRLEDANKRLEEL